MIARLHTRHARAHLAHDARPFMAEDGGKEAFRIGARKRERVGVTDAGRSDLDQHFSRMRTFQVDIGDGERFAGFPGDGGFCLHWLAPGRGNQGE